VDEEEKEEEEEKKNEEEEAGKTISNVEGGGGGQCPLSSTAGNGRINKLKSWEQPRGKETRVTMPEETPWLARALSSSSPGVTRVVQRLLHRLKPTVRFTSVASSPPPPPAERVMPLVVAEYNFRTDETDNISIFLLRRFSLAYWSLRGEEKKRVGETLKWREE
jgi:hypothetical protein